MSNKHSQPTKALRRSRGDTAPMPLDAVAPVPPGWFPRAAYDRLRRAIGRERAWAETMTFNDGDADHRRVQR